MGHLKRYTFRPRADTWLQQNVLGRTYCFSPARNLRIHNCCRSATLVYYNGCLKCLLHIRCLYEKISPPIPSENKILFLSQPFVARSETLFFFTVPYKISNTDVTHSNTHQQPCISARTVRAALRRYCCCCCRRRRHRVRTKTRRWRSRFPAVRARDPGASSIPAKTGWEIRFVERPCPRLLSAFAVRPANTIVVNQ